MKAVSPSSLPLAYPSVLVLEPDADTRHTYVELLGKQFTVTAVESFEGGLAHLARTRPAVLVTDPRSVRRRWHRTVSSSEVTREPAGRVDYHGGCSARAGRDRSGLRFGSPQTLCAEPALCTPQSPRTQPKSDIADAARSQGGGRRPPP